MENNETRGGYLAVGEGHQLYYESYGNANGVPVIFLHGGPGLGFSEGDRDFFDPTRFFVVFFDQRGAAQSQPTGGLDHNTSSDLVSDINQLLDFFSLEQVIVFGGSWGSTLALLYAIQHPERVMALILRGLFTGSLANRAHYEDGGNAPFFPEAWDRYLSHVPEEKRDRPSAYYFEQILSGDEETRRKYAYEMTFYGISVSRKVIGQAEVEAMLQDYDYLTRAIILAHYSVHDFFIPDGFIENNLDRIGSIPVSIVHGRYDMICPARFALEVHQKLENSSLFFVDAGHSSGEVEIKKRLKTELRSFLK